MDSWEQTPDRQVVKMIPYGKQNITQQDIDAVVDVLKSDFLTQGPVVPEFEHQLAIKVGARYGIATTNATAALHLACLALGLGPGDCLWTSPVTFVASANCALYCGASVDFVDIDPKTYNLCPVQLEKKLVAAEAEDRLPKIVIPVHLAGQSCDMAAIYSLSRKYGFKIIEDASHAIGGRYKGEYIGSGQYSDITVFSFHPVKIITTAEGGMAVTNDSELSKKMSLLRSHGITRDPDLMTVEPEGPWYYQQIELGFNYRMTELQAALGLSQLTRLDDFVSHRHVMASRYNDLLAELPVTTPWQHPDSYSGMHLYIIRLQRGHVQKAHQEVFEYLRYQGVGVNLHYIPVHTQPYFQSMGFKAEAFPQAMTYYQEAISLPMFFGLDESTQDEIVRLLREALND